MFKRWQTRLEGVHSKLICNLNLQRRFCQHWTRPSPGVRANRRPTSPTGNEPPAPGVMQSHLGQSDLFVELDHLPLVRRRRGVLAAVDDR